MFIIYDYRWYDEGLYFAFLQRQNESVYDPYYSIKEDIYKTPENADTDAILVRYSLSLSCPSGETTDMGISREVGMGIVHYVKAKLAEDSGDMKMYQWHYNRFLYYVNTHNRNMKAAPPRKVMPSAEALR